MAKSFVMIALRIANLRFLQSVNDEFGRWEVFKTSEYTRGSLLQVVFEEPVTKGRTLYEHSSIRIAEIAGEGLQKHLSAIIDRNHRDMGPKTISQSVKNSSFLVVIVRLTSQDRLAKSTYHCFLPRLDENPDLWMAPAELNPAGLVRFCPVDGTRMDAVVHFNQITGL